MPRSEITGEDPVERREVSLGEDTFFHSTSFLCLPLSSQALRVQMLSDGPVVKELAVQIFGIVVGYMWPRSKKLNITVNCNHLKMLKEPLFHYDDKQGKLTIERNAVVMNKCVFISLEKILDNSQPNYVNWTLALHRISRLSINKKWREKKEDVISVLLKEIFCTNNLSVLGNKMSIRQETRSGET